MENNLKAPSIHLGQPQVTLNCECYTKHDFRSFEGDVSLFITIWHEYKNDFIDLYLNSNRWYFNLKSPSFEEKFVLKLAEQLLGIELKPTSIEEEQPQTPFNLSVDEIDSLLDGTEFELN